MAEPFAEVLISSPASLSLSIDRSSPGRSPGWCSGLLSPIALLSSVLWLCAVRHRRQCSRAAAAATGRQPRGTLGRAVGLGLSVLFGVVPVAQTAADYMLRDQPRELADLFLDIPAARRAAQER